MVVLKPYQATDLALIQGRAYELELDGRQYAEQFARGPAFTVWNGDEPVAAGGVVIYWKGVGEAWLYLSNWIYAEPLRFCRIVKYGLRRLIEDNQLVRVQAPLLAENIAFARMLGFQPECTLRRYGPDGKDYYMHAIVKERECLQQ